MKLNLRYLSAWILLASFVSQQVPPISAPGNLAPRSGMVQSAIKGDGYHSSIPALPVPPKKQKKEVIVGSALTKMIILVAVWSLLGLPLIVHSTGLWNLSRLELTPWHVALYSLGVLAVTPFVTRVLASRCTSLGMFFFYSGFVYVALYVGLVVFVGIVVPILVLLHAQNLFNRLYPKMTRFGRKLKVIIRSKNPKAVDILKALIESPEWRNWEMPFTSVECPFHSWKEDHKKAWHAAAMKNWREAFYHIQGAIENAKSEFKSMELDDILKNFAIGRDLIIYLNILEAYFAARIHNRQETKTALQTAINIISGYQADTIHLAGDLNRALHLLGNDLQAVPAFEHSL